MAPAAPHAAAAAPGARGGGPRRTTAARRARRRDAALFFWGRRSPHGGGGVPAGGRQARQHRAVGFRSYLVPQHGSGETLFYCGASIRRDNNLVVSIVLLRSSSGPRRRRPNDAPAPRAHPHHGRRKTFFLDCKRADPRCLTHVCCSLPRIIVARTLLLQLARSLRLLGLQAGVHSTNQLVSVTHFSRIFFLASHERRCALGIHRHTALSESNGASCNMPSVKSATV